MKPTPQAVGGIAPEIHELYLHLLNLKKEDGMPATDGLRLHRDIAESFELRQTPLDAAALARFASGEQEIAPEHLEALRIALGQAHRRAVDVKFTWKPRWLGTPQGVRHAHPSVANHALHHHPMES